VAIVSRFPGRLGSRHFRHNQRHLFHLIDGDTECPRVIQINALNYRYAGAAQEAIRDLSLEIRSGSLFGLLGPNGSGKTTLISILTGLLAPTSGEVRIDGHSLPRASRAVQAFSASVPQEYAFYPRLTVNENLRFFAGVLSIPASETHERLRAALVAAGLEGFKSMRAEHLSGGLKRRLNLAIGLLNRPRLVFLDEPTVGIDPQSRHFILETIRQINAAGTTVVYTSHYMDEVEGLCNEIGVLDQGRLLARGTLAQLLNRDGTGTLVIGLTREPTPSQRAALTAIPDLKITGAELRVANSSTLQLQQLLSQLSACGLGATRVRYGYGNLEDLFLHLTGRQLRD
jgi:ABC-2 type transport system ATP-binding protein